MKSQAMVLTVPAIMAILNAENITEVYMGLVECTVPIKKHELIELLEQSMRCDIYRRYRIYVTETAVYIELMHVVEEK